MTTNNNDLAEIKSELHEHRNSFRQINAQFEQVVLEIRRNGVFIEEVKHNMQLVLEAVTGNYESQSKKLADHEERINRLELRG